MHHVVRAGRGTFAHLVPRAAHPLRGESQPFRAGMRAGAAPPLEPAVPPGSAPSADAYISARTAACVHARWHGAGRLSRGDLLVGGLDAAAGSTRRWDSTGAGPGASPSFQGDLRSRERAARGAQAGGLRSRLRLRLRCASGATSSPSSSSSSSFIRTASARPSTHRQVRWGSDGGRWGLRGGRGGAPSSRVGGRGPGIRPSPPSRARRSGPGPQAAARPAGSPDRWPFTHRVSRCSRRD